MWWAWVTSNRDFDRQRYRWSRYQRCCFCSFRVSFFFWVLFFWWGSSYGHVSRSCSCVMLDWCCWASAEHLLTSTARYLIGCVTASCSQALHHCAVSPPPWTLSFCSYFHEFLPRKPVRNQVSWVHCQTAIWMQLFHVLRTPSHYASQSFIRAFELFHSRMQIHQSLWSGL